MPGVKSVTASDQVPITLSNNTGEVTWPGKNANKNIFFNVLGTDHEFISTMGIQLKEGRYFSQDYGADSEKIVLNEEAVRQMQVQNPIGLKLNFWGSEGQVIGVVKDFHTTSMQVPMQPLIMVFSPDYSLQIFARTEAGKTQEVITSLQALTKKYNPQYPFEYHFMDDDFEQMYRSEVTIGKLANYFAVIAIIISCLGLFGLALFTAEQRTKEIGIRKVLGASVTGIIAMLSKDFLKLVLIANIIAWPLGWYLMHNWLQHFAFRVDIGWWIFALAGAATLLIALLTVSYQAVRAAVVNPVQSLRSE
jgi:ABC-type antimicrobial peptide transport system permease subunit